LHVWLFNWGCAIDKSALITTHCEGISDNDRDILVSVAQAVFSICSINKYQASLIFVSDEDIQSLNREYRGLDEVTDVLSFSNSHSGHFYGECETQKDDLTDELFVLPEEFSHQVGEVLISLMQAERQSYERTVSLMDELKLLVAHGFLHLLGYDHIEEVDEQLMKEMESKVIAFVETNG